MEAWLRQSLPQQQPLDIPYGRAVVTRAVPPAKPIGAIQQCLQPSGLHSPMALAARAIKLKHKTVAVIDLGGSTRREKLYEEAAASKSRLVTRRSSNMESNDTSKRDIDGRDGRTGIDGLDGETACITLAGNPRQLQVFVDHYANGEDGKYDREEFVFDLGESDGVLLIRALGEDGADGTEGADGFVGKTGKDGIDDLSQLIATGSQDGVRGADGEAGGNGGRGGDGGKGGAGGKIVIRSLDPFLLNLVEVDVRGGFSGKGAKGGIGAPGGKPGRGAVVSSGGKRTRHSDGVEGPRGRNGLPGHDGEQGALGRTLFQLIDETGQALDQGEDRFNLAILDYTIVDENGDGIFEPGTEIILKDIKVINNGRMRMPAGAVLSVAGHTVDAKFFAAPSPESSKILEKIDLYEVITLVSPVKLRIPDACELSEDSCSTWKGELKLRITISLLNRLFQDSLAVSTIPLGFPVYISRMESQSFLGPNECCQISVEITNVSFQAFGGTEDTYVQLGMQGMDGVKVLQEETDEKDTCVQNVSDHSYFLVPRINQGECVRLSALICLSEHEFGRLFESASVKTFLYLRGMCVDSCKLSGLRMIPAYPYPMVMKPQSMINSDVLLVTSSLLSRSEYVSWCNLFHFFDLSYTIWDIERYEGKLTDSLTNERPWVGACKYVIVPHSTGGVDSKTGFSADDVWNHFNNSKQDGVKPCILFVDTKDTDLFKCLYNLKSTVDHQAGSKFSSWRRPSRISSTEKKAKSIACNAARKHLKKDPSSAFLSIVDLNVKSGTMKVEYGALSVHKSIVDPSSRVIHVDSPLLWNEVNQIDDFEFNDSLNIVPLKSNIVSVMMAMLCMLPIRTQLQLVISGHLDFRKNFVIQIRHSDKMNHPPLRKRRNSSLRNLFQTISFRKQKNKEPEALNFHHVLMFSLELEIAEETHQCDEDTSPMLPKTTEIVEFCKENAGSMIVVLPFILAALDINISRGVLKVSPFQSAENAPEESQQQQVLSRSKSNKCIAELKRIREDALAAFSYVSAGVCQDAEELQKLYGEVTKLWSPHRRFKLPLRNHAQTWIKS